MHASLMLLSQNINVDDSPQTTKQVLKYHTHNALQLGLPHSNFARNMGINKHFNHIIFTLCVIEQTKIEFSKN